MKNLKVQVRRSVASFAAAGVLSLAAGIAPASALTVQDCKTNYQSYGFTSYSDCVVAISNGKPKHR